MKILLLDKMASCRAAQRGVPESERILRIADVQVVEKKVRQETVIAMRLEGKSYREIGDMLSISRQRVEQLASPARATLCALKARAGERCERCGIPVNGSGHTHHAGQDIESYQSMDNLVYLCRGCHRIIHALDSHRFHWTQLVCSECGCTFERRNSYIKSGMRREYGRIWCSKECQGHWLGKNHGRGRKA